MSFLDGLSTKVHDELKTLASQHPSFESFMQDMEKLGEKMWHNARSQAEADAVQAAEQAKTDAEQAAADARTAARNDLASNGGDGDFKQGSTGDPAPAAQMTPGPTGEPADSGTVTEAPEPPSPVSDAGFPTSNVGVVVNPDPSEGTPVPVQESQPVEEGTSQPAS